MTDAGGGCDLSDLSSITRVRTAWGKFRELLHMLTSRSPTPHTPGQLYNTYVCSSYMPVNAGHPPSRFSWRFTGTTEPWSDGSAMFTLMIESAGILFSRSIESIRHYNRLRWHGHVERRDGWINKVMSHVVEGSRSRGRPKKTWSDCIQDDRKEWRMTKTDAMNRAKWRSSMRTAMPKRATHGDVEMTQ